MLKGKRQHVPQCQSALQRPQELFPAAAVKLANCLHTAHTFTRILHSNSDQIKEAIRWAASWFNGKPFSKIRHTSFSLEEKKKF